MVVGAPVMATVGAPEMPGAGPLEACAAWLGSRRALLLLDNCEHLAGACAEAALRLLEACPRLLVLATSRTPLGVAGETVYPVPPLATPDERTPRWRPAAGYDAVRLLLERARSAGGGTRGEADLALAGELCRRLDGLPLAIEFAAARTRAMSLSEIAAGMTDRFALLAPARRAGPERHRTLRAAIDWSHDLLTSDEQVLLRRLSVFDGGFTADAAAAVCADSLTAATPDLMHHLLDASLIVPEPGGEQTRYRLFETVREYAAGRLTGPAERDRAEEQHTRYYCAFAEHANAELQGPGEQAWLHRLDAEQDNLRAALRYSAKPAADAALLASTAIALAPFWRLRGMLKEGAGWLQAALSTADDGSVQQAALRICLGSIRYRQSEFGEAAPLLTAGIRTARARAERALVANGLRWLAGTHVRCGRLARAVPLAEEAVAIWEQLGNTVAAAWPRGMLADIAVWEGRFTEAQSLYEQGLGTLRAQGPPSMLVGYLHSMSELAYATGDLDRAEALCHEALPIAEQVGDVWHVGNLHDVLARLSRRRGNPRLAFRHGLLALERFEDLHCINEIAEAIEVLGGSAIDTGDIPHGALLLAGARQLRRASGIPLVEVALRTTTEADWETVIRLCSSTLNAIEQRAATLTLDQLIGAAKRDLANPQTR